MIVKELKEILDKYSDWDEVFIAYEDEDGEDIVGFDTDREGVLFIKRKGE